MGREGGTHFLNICIFSSSFVLLLKAEFWANGSREWHTHTHTPLNFLYLLRITHTLDNRTGTKQPGWRRILEWNSTSFISSLKGDQMTRAHWNSLQLSTWADLYERHVRLLSDRSSSAVLCNKFKQALRLKHSKALRRTDHTHRTCQGLVQSHFTPNGKREIDILHSKKDFLEMIHCVILRKRPS